MSNQTLKLSYQPVRSYKLVGFVQRGYKGQPERWGDRFRPRENTVDFWFAPLSWKGELQATPNDKFLFNILLGRHGFEAHRDLIEDVAGKPTRFDRETSRWTGPSDVFSSDSPLGGSALRIRKRWIGHGSASFFPKEFPGGRHAFKVGVMWESIRFGDERPNRAAGNYRLVYDRVGGIPFRPVEIVTYNVPLEGAGNRMTEYSAYGKDSWTIRERLTLNLGLRWERYHSFVEKQTKPQGLFGSAGTFPAVDVLTWSALAPRIGAAFDVAGDGRTVVKGTYGWFNHTFLGAEAFAGNYNQNELVLTRYRWRDLDGNKDYTPGEVNLDPNGPDFLSISGARNNILNPDLQQPVTHEITAALERELVANFSARALYVYKRQHKLYEAVNILRPYSAYNILVNRRDPGPDGILGTADDAGQVALYDYDPAFRGARFVGNKFLNRDGGRDDSYSTVELTLNKRTSQNWDMLASFLATKNHRWIDAIPENPNEEFFPIDNTWSWLFKLTGSYRFPYQLQAAAFFQHLSGDPGQRTYIFRTADPDGGRPLTQLGTVTLRLEPFGARRNPNLNVLNLRLAKMFSLGRQKRLEVDIDLFNTLNANTAQAIRYAAGPTFGAITAIVPPRIVRFGTTFSF